MGGPEMAPQPPHPLVAPRRSRGAPRPHPLVAPRRSRGAPRPQPLVAPRRSRGAPRPQPLVAPRRSRGAPRPQPLVAPRRSRGAPRPHTLGAPRRSRGTPRYADTRLVCDPRRRVTPLAHAPVHRLTIDRDEDRKSTRLNSSHLVISYSVFWLKKKNRSVAY